MFLNTKSPSLCSKTFHTFRCVGEVKGLCVRLCVSERRLAKIHYISPFSLGEVLV